MPEANYRSNLVKSSSVIECTSCSTRFAVDAQQISQIDEPIFHCSRCGHYFGIKKSAKEESEKVESIEKKEEVIPEEAPATQLSLMPESLNPEPDFTVPLDNKTNFESIGQNKVTNVSSWYKRNNIDQLLDEDDNKVKAEWPDQKNNENKYFIEPVETYHIDETPTLDYHDFEMDEEEEYDFDEMCLPKETQKNFVGNVNINPQTKISFAVLSIPVLMAVFLAAWGLNIDKTPEFLSSVFHMDSKLLASVAPQGLALASLTPEVVTLDSGEKAFRIKGSVINSTGLTFSNLTLEAKLFTKDNRELARIIAPLDNSLRDTQNISALNSESIERLQSELTEEQTTIPPNVKIPFSLVVPGVKGDESWYSARIYSVHKI